MSSVKSVIRPDMDHTEYHEVQQQIAGAIDHLKSFTFVLNDAQKKQISEIIGVCQDESEGVGISDIMAQYRILQKIQGQILDPNNQVLDDCEPRELASMMTSMSALLKVFMHHQKDLDAMKEQADLKDAVYEAIATLPKAEQAKFFEKLTDV